MLRTIYLRYLVNNALDDAYSVTLASQDETYGIKDISGNVIVASGSTVDHTSTGIYEYTYDFSENLVYKVSWRVQPNAIDPARFVVEEVGPFVSATQTIRAVAEFRGSFIQGSRATVFLKIAELNGNPIDADTISITIGDEDANEVNTGTPEKVDLGFYAYDWNIAADQTPGQYVVNWSYQINGADRVELQKIIVAENATDTFLYSGRVSEMRAGLEHMIHYAQHIPVYNEQAKHSADNKTYRFTFGRWNQSPGCRIYRNGVIVDGGVSINYEQGYITFDSTLTAFDVINADYNFRWFSDEELDRFLSNAIHMYNLFPPVTRKTLMSVDDINIPIILYGAIVDALRYMMLSLKFQEPQLVFGGPEAAAKAFADFETLKKNYEETWNKLLEQKKLGPYKGLTRFISTPAFSLPGGRSRWFRYLFSSGTG